eukprot:TRINITY_DN24211_c0_g1_i1.p1 TRINITY_DN24211_c0_g1~~TRINITY_DN24211_c0_g1_i1.p1  ORF type:complete len:126 (-),score=4.63 TRINITY_DN24211_c0_g1_i1:150-527(-)
MELKQAPMPNLDHFSSRDYTSFYEPSDDTYLLIDVLYTNLPLSLPESPPYLNILEIGPGSGSVITSLAQTLSLIPKLKNTRILFYALDINPAACLATQKTFFSPLNNCQDRFPYREVLQMDLSSL